MAQKPKGPQLDRKTELTFKTVETLKASSNVFQEFVKAATNYQKQCMKMSEAGKLLAESLQKVGQLQQNQQTDIAEGINKLADIIRNMELKRDQMVRTIQEDLINTLQKAQKPEETELTAFETEYKKARDNARQQIAKLEANSKKAGKKGPEALKQSIAALNDKIKEADQVKADKLRTVLLLERKKYCNFLSQWGPVISAEVDIVNEEMKFKEHEQYWKTLASSTQQLPKSLEELIKAPTERTLVNIQSDGSGGYTTGGYENEYDYDSGSYGGGGGGGYGGPIGTGGGYGGGGSFNGGGLGTATALYDFAGEQAEDLPFYAGEVITITKEDDGSGWLTGELNGRTGIFPSSYVTRK